MQILLVKLMDDLGSLQGCSKFSEKIILYFILVQQDSASNSDEGSNEKINKTKQLSIAPYTKVLYYDRDEKIDYTCSLNQNLKNNEHLAWYQKKGK